MVKSVGSVNLPAIAMVKKFWNIEGQQKHYVAKTVACGIKHNYNNNARDRYDTSSKVYRAEY